MSDPPRRVAPTEPIVPGTRASAPEAPGLDAAAVIAKLRAARERRYTELAHVAQGGMGSVELVEDSVIGRHCAMKRIHAAMIDDDAAVRFFVREAQITGQLEHPNVVPVYDLGDAEGRPRFTMKHIDGRTFRELIEQFPPGPLERGTLFDLLDIVVKVCDALSYAHSRGVVHLDIKPDNVMVGDFGQVYLMDWGIARVLAEPDDMSATRPRPKRGRVQDPFQTGGGSVNAGTPSHMAPEQACGEPVDPRTDVWAVGALLYHLVSRRAPYEAGTVIERVMLAREASFPPLRAMGEIAPAALLAIIERAMAREPADRYPSVIALQRALVRFLRGEESLPVRAYAPGQDIIREGDAADAAYLIVSGRCEAHRMVRGERTSLRTMGPGDLFGETAILSPGPRTATVTAIDRVTVHVITAQLLESELRGAQPWLAAIVRTLAARFRERG